MLQCTLLCHFDRDCDVTEKKRGDGVCMKINETWCPGSDITAITFDLLPLLPPPLPPSPPSDPPCPCYLSHGFGQVFVSVVYIPPWACQARAAQQVADTVRELLLLSADAPNFIVRDFNSIDLRSCLSSFEQSATGSTQEDKTIDLCYGNIPGHGVFQSFALPPIENSDHNDREFRSQYSAPRASLQTKGADTECREETCASVV